MTSVVTAFDLEIVEGIREDIMGAPEHRQMDVVVEVLAADRTGTVTLETLERVYDDTSNCDLWPFPLERIDGVSVRNRFDPDGKLKDRQVLSADPEIVRLVKRSFSPVLDVGYVPPPWVMPGDSWTCKVVTGDITSSSTYTRYPDGPCITGQRCLMVTLDESTFADEHPVSHGQYDIVADDSGALVRESGIIQSGYESFRFSTSTRFSIERVNGPSPRPSWMPAHFAKLRVVLMPWALVRIDGRLNASGVQTPFCARVSAGHHTVRLVNEYLFRDEAIDVTIRDNTDEAVVIFRNWCRHLARAPGCEAEFDDNDDLRDMVRQDLAGGEIQQLLEEVQRP